MSRILEVTSNPMRVDLKTHTNTHLASSPKVCVHGLTSMAPIPPRTSRTCQRACQSGEGTGPNLRKSRFGITFGQGSVPTICCLGRQGNKEEEMGRDGGRWGGMEGGGEEDK